MAGQGRKATSGMPRIPGVFGGYPGQFLPESRLFELRQSGHAIRSQGPPLVGRAGLAGRLCSVRGLQGGAGQFSQMQEVPANSFNQEQCGNRGGEGLSRCPI